MLVMVMCMALLQCMQYEKQAIAGSLCADLCHLHTIRLSSCTLHSHGFRVINCNVHKLQNVNTSTQRTKAETIDANLQQQQLLCGPSTTTTWVSRYQEIVLRHFFHHNPGKPVRHVNPPPTISFSTPISVLHLLQTIAYSLFILKRWQQA